MKTWIAFWNILKKDIQNYYLKPPNISWGIIFPLSWTLMQLISSSGGMNMSDIRTLLPGLMAMSVLFGTTSMLAVTITFERKGRSFDRLLLAPISLSTMVAAKLSGAILFGLFNAFVPVLFASFFVDFVGINWGAALLAVFFIAVTSALLGLTIAVSAKEVFEAQTFSNFFPVSYVVPMRLVLSHQPSAHFFATSFLSSTFDIWNGSAQRGNSKFRNAAVCIVHFHIACFCHSPVCFLSA